MLFRIDRNVIGQNQIKSAKIDVMPDVEIEHEEEPFLDEDFVDGIEESEEDKEIRLKKKEIKQLEKQIEATQRKAHELIEAAKIEAEEIKEDAMKTGYKDGQEKAQVELEKELLELRAQAKKFVFDLTKECDSVYEQIQASVLDFSLFIAQRIIKIELDKSDEAYFNIVREILKQVKDDTELILRVNSTDYDKYFTDEDNDFVSLLRSSGVEIKRDFKTEESTCSVETDYGTLRNGVKEQLRKMGQMLSRAE